MTKFSIEVIPPKDQLELEVSCENLRVFKDLDPIFISVTRRAEGDFRCTIDTSSFIQRELSIPALAHIAAIQFPKDEIHSFISALHEASVSQLLVVRGDDPIIKEKETFETSLDLIHALKKNNFKGEIAVAAMPEGYPGDNTTEGMKRSVTFLKQKQKEGAGLAITQLFLSINKYHEFLDECVRQGVHIPIIPGVMSIANSKRLLRMQTLTGMEIPPEVSLILSKYGDDKESFKKAGNEFTINLCRKLIELKVPGIHLFSFNNVKEVREIYSGIG